MTEFHEAAEELRAAQLQKLSKELQDERTERGIVEVLAHDRGERIIELARIGNDLKDQCEKLQADSKRLAFMVRTRANVEFSARAGKYWLLFPCGFSQAGLFDTPTEAIDAAMESER